jgi:ketosteroid isomerase-like protein
MKTIYLVLLLFSFSQIKAQINVLSIQQEIDKTVWKPFHDAFENADGKALNALYADEVLRVSYGKIDTQEEFKSKNLKNFEESKKLNVQIELDFWFDSRSTNENTSYEVGYYRIIRTVDGKSTKYYGQFHIVLKKVNGIWKITQDWDTPVINGNKIGKEDFEKNDPLDFSDIH